MILNGNKIPAFFKEKAGGKKLNKGISIVEVLIAVVIIGVGLAALFGAIAFAFKISGLIEETTVANALSQEAIEAVRSFRDGTTWDTDGLETLSTGESSPHYPELDAGSLPKRTLPEGTETVNGFTRKIIFEKVSRDPITGDIEDVYGAGNDDSDTRKVIARVSWKDKEVEIITYLTNWKQ